MRWLDLVDSINVIARIETMLGALRHSRPRGLHGKPGSLPTGSRQMRLRRANMRRISGTDAVKHLQQRGIRCWGERTTTDWFIWYVNAAQHDWAHEVLRRYLAGNSVPAWKERKHGRT